MAKLHAVVFEPAELRTKESECSRSEIVCRNYLLLHFRHGLVMHLMGGTVMVVVNMFPVSGVPLSSRFWKVIDALLVWNTVVSSCATTSTCSNDQAE